jgi:hypothetical protein
LKTLRSGSRFILFYLYRPPPSVFPPPSFELQPNKIPQTKTKTRRRRGIRSQSKGKDKNATMATSWFLDFCFVCDRQTGGGAYCSQKCRLAELDISCTGSEPSSPMTMHPPDHPWSNQAAESGSGLHLGPPIDFAGYRALGSSSRPQGKQSAANDHSLKSSNSSSFSTLFSSRRRTLTPSSSQTSLSSLQSVSTSRSSLSGQARSELEDYTGCFDQVRDWKRRLTSS